jgi:hypothetical protein
MKFRAQSHHVMDHMLLRGKVNIETVGAVGVIRFHKHHTTMKLLRSRIHGSLWQVATHPSVKGRCFCDETFAIITRLAKYFFC